MTSCHDLTSVEVVQRIAAIPMERSGLSGLIDDLALPSVNDDFESPPPPPSPLAGAASASDGRNRPMIWPTNSKRRSPTNSLLSHGAQPGRSGGDGPSSGATCLALPVDADLSEHLFGYEGGATGTSTIVRSTSGSRIEGVACCSDTSAAATTTGCALLREGCARDSVSPPLCCPAEGQQQGEREGSPRSVATSLGADATAAPDLAPA